MSDSDHSHVRGIPVGKQSIKEHNQLITSWWIMVTNNAVHDRCSRCVKKAVIVPIVGVIFLWNVIPAHCLAKWFLFVSSIYGTCAVDLRVETCWLHNIYLVETLKLVKYIWTEIRNLDGILDGIGDFGQMENDILDSTFVQSLYIVQQWLNKWMGSFTYEHDFTTF